MYRWNKYSLSFQKVPHQFVSVAESKVTDQSKKRKYRHLSNRLIDIENISGGFFDKKKIFFNINVDVLILIQGIV